MRARFNLIQKVFVSTALVGTVMLFQNCSEQQFSTLQSSVSATGNCTTQLNNIQTPVEMIFVVDLSGSNAPDAQNNNPGTDPDKAVRGGAISRFWEAYNIKNNFAWTFISFKNNNAEVQLSSGNGQEMLAVVDWFLGTTDSGNTPYGTALDKTKDALENRVNSDPDKKYVILFLSDGVPNPSISDSSVKSKIQDILDVSPEQVSLSTVYYGPKNDNASARLAMMAQKGGGNFLDTNANPSGNFFAVNDIVTIPGVVCQ